MQDAKSVEHGAEGKKRKAKKDYCELRIYGRPRVQGTRQKETNLFYCALSLAPWASLNSGYSPRTAGYFNKYDLTSSLKAND
jgi:hypothetical protein